jgi:hypothetical protein
VGESSGKLSGSPYQTTKQRQQEKNQEDKKQKFCNASRRDRDPAKAKYCGDDRYDKER